VVSISLESRYSFGDDMSTDYTAIVGLGIDLGQSDQPLYLALTQLSIPCN
jgi:hypothetical protein